MTEQQAQAHLQKTLEAQANKGQIRDQIGRTRATLAQIEESLAAFEDAPNVDPEAINVLAAFEDDLERWIEALEFWAAA